MPPQIHQAELQDHQWRTAKSIWRAVAWSDSAARPARARFIFFSIFFFLTFFL
jgi:hypothetical protein